MRDLLNLSAYGAGFILNGEPTGDETPPDDWTPTFTQDRPCRHCGADTSASSCVCIDCELNRAGTGAEPARPPAVVLLIPPRMRHAA